MSSRESSYYYGSYGIVRGYGPLCRTLKEADESVATDDKRQRQKGGITDRNSVIVTPEDGLCWWADEEEDTAAALAPIMTPYGAQARYATEILQAYEVLWSAPKELAGFG